MMNHDRFITITIWGPELLYPGSAGLTCDVLVGVVFKVADSEVKSVDPKPMSGAVTAGERL